MDSKNQNVFITGGSRGIGAATAIKAAKHGYGVCFTYRSNESAAHSVRERIERAGGNCLAIQADFESEADIVNAWQSAIDALGTVRVLVNNVGVLETQLQLVDVTAERLQRIFMVNSIAAILNCREAVRHMSRSRGGQGGAIVNISSLAAKLGSPNEYIDYAASKGAVDTLTVGLAKEVAEEGIRVNAVRPGAINTEIHALGGEPERVARVSQNVPMRRGGEPDEIAEAILWLASDEASYATGAILDVAGGV